MIGQELARRIFERDNFQCKFCGEFFSEDQPALHCHHRVFKSQGGQDEEINLISCCWRCHHNHGALKGAKLIDEDDYSTINELTKRYRSKRASIL